MNRINEGIAVTTVCGVIFITAFINGSPDGMRYTFYGALSGILGIIIDYIALKKNKL